jgi:nitric oxide reductase subunit B
MRMHFGRYWVALVVVMVFSFGVLGAYEPRIRDTMPPIPERVIGPDGRVVTDGAAIRRGQNVWQSIGGQEVGSIWGHGAYVAPDWSADWLHREAVFVLDRWAGAPGGYEKLPAERQAALRERLTGAMRRNTYDPATGTVTIGAERVAAYAANAEHFSRVFRDGEDAYAIP